MPKTAGSFSWFQEQTSVGFKNKRIQREKRIQQEKSQKERIQQLRLFIEEKEDEKQSDNNQQGTTFNFDELKAAIDDAEKNLDEIAMLRVLAGMGLSIGEFVHEIRQFSPAFEGDLSVLFSSALNEEMKQGVSRLSRNFEQLQSYAAYFDETIHNN